MGDIFGFCQYIWGVILLGVKENEDGSFSSAGLRNSEKLKKDLWNTLNNPNKISSNILTDSNIKKALPFRWEMPF